MSALLSHLTDSSNQTPLQPNKELMSTVQHLMYFPCCDVLYSTSRNGECWMCGERCGKANATEYTNNQRPYYQTSSTVYMECSKVKPEVLKWPNP